MMPLFATLYFLYGMVHLYQRWDKLIVDSYLAAPRKRQALAVFAMAIAFLVFTWPVWVVLKLTRKST